MKKTQVTINSLVFDLTIHDIDGEVSEVYASSNGMEIEFAYDMESMMEKLTIFAEKWGA